MRIVVLGPEKKPLPLSSPWHYLLAGLRASGHEVKDFGYWGQDADALVALNYRRSVVEIQSSLDIGPRRSALVVLEPRVTHPMMYESRALQHFSHRFAASPMWAHLVGGVPFNWPQKLHFDTSDSQTSGFASTMINADKRSAVTGSRYGLRRSVIRLAEQSNIPIALFGHGWHDSRSHRCRQAGKAIAKTLQARKLPHVREALSDVSMKPALWNGTVKDKANAFSLASTSIVIENSSDYVSEKLIDAVCAGVVPIYVGPSLERFGLPPEIVIPSPPIASAILQRLRETSDKQLQQVQSAGNNWLQSTKAHQHGFANVLTNLAIEISSHLEIG